MPDFGDSVRVTNLYLQAVERIRQPGMTQAEMVVIIDVIERSINRRDAGSWRGG